MVTMCTHFTTFYMILLTDLTTISDFGYLKRFLTDRIYTCSSSTDESVSDFIIVCLEQR